MKDFLERAQIMLLTPVFVITWAYRIGTDGDYTWEGLLIAVVVTFIWLIGIQVTQFVRYREWIW